MSIEKLIAELTAALEANTAAMLKSGGTATAPAAAPTAAPAEAPAAEAPKRGRPAKTAPAPEAAAPTVDRSAVNAALEKVKEAHGVEAAKGIISKFGKAAKRADIADENLKAVYDACKAQMEPADEQDEDM